MCKARIYALKSDLQKVTNALYDYGAIELKQFNVKHASLFPVSGQEHKMNNLDNSERLMRLESILKNFGNYGVVRKISWQEAKSLLKSAEMKKLELEIAQLSKEIENVVAKTDSLKEDINRLRFFSKFDIDFSMAQLESAELIVGIVRRQNSNSVEKILKSDGVLYSIVKPHSQNSSMCVVLVRKGDEKTVEELTKAGFERLPVLMVNGKPAHELAKAEKLLAKLEKEKELLESRAQKLVAENFAKLAGMKEFLEIEQYKNEASLKFGSTEDTIIVEGYLPENNFNLLEKSIASKLGQRAHVEKISSEELEKHHEQAPTLLKNSKVFKPFQFIVNYMSTPKSNEIDTTVIFAFVFMLFYGIIVGDVVYGLISFLIARWVYRKSSKDSILKPVSLLWMYGAIPTMVAGIIFDEYAGLPHRELFALLGLGHVELYTGFERMHNTQLILAVSLLIGIVTMAFAFLLGFINAVRHNDKRHAAAKLAWFGIVVTGTVLVATSMFKAFPETFMVPAGVLFAISTIIMIKEEGPIGLIEIPSVAGNILSFARLIAVGLVGTVIAFILNEMAMPTPDKGLMLVVFLPIFILGHLFNAFLAMFEALIQGARLNFVEFYSKFFEGGGKEFQPFKFENKYLKSMEVD